MPQKKIFNPYPGLRSFETHEDYLFFGRDEQINTLVKKLREKRFLAVVGSSGCGKSSLVKAGLISSLNGGLMAQIGSAWRYVIFRPGLNPFENLTNELYNQNIYPKIDSKIIDLDSKKSETNPDEIDSGDAYESINKVIVQNTLKRSFLGLVDVIKQSGLNKNERLLIVADQFEELFRFKEARDDKGQKSAFVKILLEASKNQDVPVYVVITMRSDYIGECSQFRNLPETINESQFLVPKMTRDQIKETILGPSFVGGNGLDERLVQCLLNDVFDNQDHLPVLQHALMRTWYKWQENPVGKPDLKHYEEIGRMEMALSQHADEAYNSLSDERSREIACGIFKCLTEKGSDNREMRRPESLKSICEIIRADMEEVIKISLVFRSLDCSFLTPASHIEITSKTILDISHESLMRIWTRLKKWVEEETQSSIVYLRLAETSVLYEKNKAGLWRNPDLQIALKWRDNIKPNAAWAKKYHPAFDSAMVFLDKSEKEYKKVLQLKEHQQNKEIRQIKVIADERAKRISAQEIAARRQKKILLGTSFGLIITIIMAIMVFILYHHAKLNQNIAISALKNVKLEQKTSRSRELSAFAMINLNKDPSFSFRLAEEALKQSPTVLAQKAIFLPLEYPLHNVLSGHTSGINYVCFSSNGKKIVSASNDKTARIWDIESGKAIQILRGHDLEVNIALFTKDDKKVLSSSNDKTALVWDASTGKIIHRLKGHEGEVRHAALSPDNELIATASYDNTAIIWDIHTGELIFQLKGHQGHVKYVDFSHDGNFLVTASDDKTLRLWDCSNGDEIYCLKGHDASVWNVNFSHDSKRIISSSFDMTAIIWDSLTGYIQNILSGHKDFVNHGLFSPDGTTVATSSYDKTIKLWNAFTGKLEHTLKGHEASVWKSSFSGDSKKIITISWDKSARIWDVKTGQCQHVLKGHEADINCAIFSPDGTAVATASSDKTIRIWNLLTGPGIHVLIGHEDELNSANFSSDNSKIITASSDKKAIVWDTFSGKKIHILKGHKSIVYKALYSRDGKYIATASYDKTIRIWDGHTGRLKSILTGHTDRIYDICFSPDGNEIVSGSNDKTVRIWDIISGREKKILKGHKSSIYFVDFSQNGKYIVSASFDRTAILWHANNGKKIHILKGHRDIVNTAVFSFDSKSVLTASDDTFAKIWDVKTAIPMLTLSGHDDIINKALFSPDSSLCVTISGSEDYGMDNTARIWDTKTGLIINVLKGHEDSINDACFSPDGRLIVTASGQDDFGLDNSARVWDTATGSEICIFKGHKDVIVSTVFSSDGKFIVTASKDKTARVWPGQYKYLLELINKKKIRGLVRAFSKLEKQKYRLMANGIKGGRLGNRNKKDR